MLASSGCFPMGGSVPKAHLIGREIVGMKGGTNKEMKV